MNVSFIPGNEVNSELGIVNAARVSLNKKSEWVDGHDGSYTTDRDWETRYVHCLP